MERDSLLSPAPRKRPCFTLELALLLRLPHSSDRRNPDPHCSRPCFLAGTQAIRVPKIPLILTAAGCQNQTLSGSPPASTHTDDSVESTQRTPRFGRCALVSSSSSLLRSECGEEIDRHDAVWRMNLPTTEGYERDVGSRTDIEVVMSWPARLLIDPSGNMYKELQPILEFVNTTSSGSPAVAVPHSHPPRQLKVRGEAVILSGGSPLLCEPFLKSQPSRWGAKRFMYASSHFSGVYKALGKFMPEHWVPSTGLRAIVLAWSMCAEITLYGFSTSVPNSTGSLYHFWDTEADTTADKSPDAEARPKHQMDKEHQLVDGLAMLDHLPLCTCSKCTPSTSFKPHPTRTARREPRLTKQTTPKNV